MNSRVHREGVGSLGFPSHRGGGGCCGGAGCYGYDVWGVFFFLVGKCADWEVGGEEELKFLFFLLVQLDFVLDLGAGRFQSFRFLF